MLRASFFWLFVVSASLLSCEAIVDLIDDKATLQRELETRECNEILGVVTAEEVKAMGAIYLQPIVDDVENSRDIIFRTAVHDLQVVKLCSSCRLIDDWYFERQARFPAHYRSYCDDGIYGYYDIQSFLAFLPLDKDTGEVLTNTKLRPFLYLHASRPSFKSAPTEAWPEDLTSMLNSVEGGTLSMASLQAPKISQFVPSLLAASSGSVAILPDYIGYGESPLNRALFWSTGYEQASIVSVLRIRQYLSEQHPCTMLDEAITLQGLEDGAYGAVFASQALRRFKIDVLNVFSASGVFDLDTMLYEAVRSVDAGQSLDQRLMSLIDLAAFSMSVGTPGYLNTGSGQDLVSGAKKLEILSGFRQSIEGSTPAGGAVTSRQATTSDLDVINPNLVALYRKANAQGFKSPCKSELVTPASQVDALCNAIAATSAYPLLLSDESQRFAWIHELELCYGKDDPAVSRQQAEKHQLARVVDTISVYDGPTGVNDDTLKPLGSDHKTISDTCRISSALFYGLQGHLPAKPEDQPAYMGPLDEEDAERCGVPKESGNGTPSGGDGGSGTTGNADNSGSDPSGQNGVEGDNPDTETGSTGTTGDNDGNKGNDTNVQSASGAVARLVPTVGLLIAVAVGL